MKKLTILFLTILILFTSFSEIAKSGFQIWPGKLTITMNEWYDKWVDTKYNKIHVTNPYSYGINVSVKLDHPGDNTITQGYSHIPDLSWIRIEPLIVYIPPRSSYTFKVILDIPKSEQSKCFNEKWETWAVFNSNLYPGGKGGMNFKVELAVKLFINTPKGEAGISQYLPIILFGSVSFFMLFIIFLLVKKRKNYLIKNEKPSSSIFFYRKKRI